MKRGSSPRRQAAGTPLRVPRRRNVVGVDVPDRRGSPTVVFWLRMYERQASISMPLPAFDVSAAATMKPCEAKWLKRAV